jgi:pachytene checkpoint protein 2
LAFVDRADIKQFIGHPSAEAIYSILYSCMMELMRTELVKPSISLVDPRSLSVITPSKDEESIRLSYGLLDIARQCSVSMNNWDLYLYMDLEFIRCFQGWSGRTLRKLPFIAYALFAQVGI